jgi:hypothetical protein
MDGQTKYNRTLDMSLAQVPYVHYQARTAVFRKHGVRTAYTFRDKAFVPMMYREKNPNQGPARDFARFATEWELRHSKIPFGDGHGSVHPVVDENGLVIAHYGSFDSNSVFVPADIPVHGKVVERPVRRVHVPGWRAVEVARIALDLKDYLETGADIIADSRPQAKPSGYSAYHTPQTSFSVITDIEGHVMLVLDSRNKDGVTPSLFSPLDLISIVKLVVFGATAAVGAVAVRTIIRRRAAKALAQTAKRELTSGSEAAAQTVATVTRRVGSLSAEEMEQYLAQVLAARPDLRRLMAARVMTGQGRMDAIKIALDEFERTQGWKIVSKTAREMEAVTTKGNIVHMRNDTKELWINNERAARWDPERFYEHTVHDLAAHALAGRGGSLGARELPFIGAEFNQATNGLFILEQTIRREGRTDWISKAFARARKK